MKGSSVHRVEVEVQRVWSDLPEHTAKSRIRMQLQVDLDLRSGLSDILLLN